MTTRMLLAFLEGRPVATNMDIDLLQLFPPWDSSYHKFPKKPIIFRLPDFPSAEDIMLAGKSCGDVKGVVTPSLNEADFGELILDELQVWLNSRGWNEPRRQAFMQWLPLSRKFGWNTYFTSQTLNGLDKQARDLLEHRVHVIRTDRMGFPVPFIGGFVTWACARMGFKLTLPRVHMGTVMYGNESPPMIVDKWNYRGTDRVRNAYNTRQKYSASYSVGSPPVKWSDGTGKAYEGVYGVGVYQYLPQSHYVDSSGCYALVRVPITERRGWFTKPDEPLLQWRSSIMFHRGVDGWLFGCAGRPEGWGEALPYLVPPPLSFKQKSKQVLSTLIWGGLLLVVLYVFALFLFLSYASKHQVKADVEGVGIKAGFSIVGKVDNKLPPAKHSLVISSDGLIKRW